MQTTVTLTGYLGKDPDIRHTAQRTVTRFKTPEPHVFEYGGRTVTDRASDIMEEPAEYDATYSSRDYGILSLATHTWQGGRRITTWHRVVVWNVDRLEHIGVRIARKGSKVTVIGRRTTFETRDGHTIDQIELADFRILQLR